MSDAGEVMRFPYGYKRPPDGGPQGMGTMLTWDEMMTKSTVKYLHPEVQRRFKAMIEAAWRDGVPLGVGTGWRVQPNPPPAGFAKPGNSWHESCPVSPTTSTAFAIDTVPNISWPWLETHCGKFGFRTFKYVGNEPWHAQPGEISASRQFATTPPTLYVWPLPDAPIVIPPPTEPPPTEPPPVEPPPVQPPTSTGVVRVDAYRKTVREGSSGKMAKFCQQQINLLAGQGVVEDGQFGPQSVAALKNVQGVLGVTKDGVCGPQTWQAFENGIKVQADSGNWG